jgi:hypothetical protein
MDDGESEDMLDDEDEEDLMNDDDGQDYDMGIYIQ